MWRAGSKAGDGAPEEGGVGAGEERGAVQEENRGAGGDLPTQSPEEESGVGAGGCGGAATHVCVRVCVVHPKNGRADGSLPPPQGNKHRQISDRLRDAQSKRWILRAEVDLINQKRDARISEINTLQLQFKAGSAFPSRFPGFTSAAEASPVFCFVCWLQHWQEKLSQLVPEQQRLTEKLRSVSLSQISRR